MKRLRQWIRRLDRRWIPDPIERENHSRVVRERLVRAAVPPDEPTDGRP